jgi:hypothetical protein
MIGGSLAGEIASSACRFLLPVGWVRMKDVVGWDERDKMG